MGTPDWFAEWAAAHCVAFGFGAEGAKTVLAWGTKFVHLFTPDELYAATAHLTGREDAPKWAGDHRPAIIAAVRHPRRKAEGRPRPDSYAAAVCRLCGGSGVVIVPHPGLDVSGRWRETLHPPGEDPDGERSATRTAAVCCDHCDKGRSTRERSVQADRPLMTLQDYTRAYPNWPDVEEARAALLAAGRTPPTDADVKRLNDLLAKARDHQRRKSA